MSQEGLRIISTEKKGAEVETLLSLFVAPVERALSDLYGSLFDVDVDSFV